MQNLAWEADRYLTQELKGQAFKWWKARQWNQFLQHQIYKWQQDCPPLLVESGWSRYCKCSQAEHMYLDWNSHLADPTFHKGRITSSWIM